MKQIFSAKSIFLEKKFGDSKKIVTFASRNGLTADVAQLVRAADL